MMHNGENRKAVDSDKRKHSSRSNSAQDAVTSMSPEQIRVLVIDDEEDVRDVVQAVLESRGVRVLTAPDGLRGLEVFKQNSADIDAVLLDMNMPGLPGPAVFEELLRVRPEVKVLLSTGYSEQEVAGHFARDRLAGFVHKPYTASMLVDKIGAALTGD